MTSAEINALLDEAISTCKQALTDIRAARAALYQTTDPKTQHPQDETETIDDL